MKVAIVILNWNGEKLLEKFLPSVIKYSLEYADVYIADNASTDNSIAFVKENYPEINIIVNKENGGYAKGYNDALKHIKADIFCLLNSDIEVTNNWLKPIIDVFNKNEKTAVVQPKILDFKDKSKFEYAGAAGGYLDFFGFPFCRGRIFNSIEKDYNQYNDEATIFWASGACLFVKSAVFFEANGFDEDYFAHQEEIDLCWRIHNLGYTIKYCGLSIVYHVGGATLNNMHPKKTFLNFRNSLFNIIKNTPSNWMIIIILSRLFLDGLAGIRFILQFKINHTFAIIKAHFSFYYYFIKFLKKRKNVKQSVKYYRVKSIVWQYFVLRKKKFSVLKNV
ncbi:MAG: glycosyltransferase family 2 protein [Flavobacteriaceae bacterium]|nr:glycosyltransferase family 2 protein [Flavobacteriaceae bacterium]